MKHHQCYRQTKKSGYSNVETSVHGTVLHEGAFCCKCKWAHTLVATANGTGRAAASHVHTFVPYGHLLNLKFLTMTKGLEEDPLVHHDPQTEQHLSLLSKYDIGQIIGRGSYGVAFSAVRKIDGEAVVIKQIKMYELDATGQAAALCEARTLSQFDHINIIRYYETMIENGCLNIVMEYAQCGDLSEVISRHAAEKRPFEEDEIMFW